MTANLLCILGTWLVCDSIFSLSLYWSKEGLKEHWIRWVRLGVGVVVVIIGRVF